MPAGKQKKQNIVYLIKIYDKIVQNFNRINLLSNAQSITNCCTKGLHQQISSHHDVIDPIQRHYFLNICLTNCTWGNCVIEGL